MEAGFPQIQLHMVLTESLLITHLIPIITIRGSEDHKIIIATEILKTANWKEILRPLESLKIL